MSQRGMESETTQTTQAHTSEASSNDNSKQDFIRFHDHTPIPTQPASKRTFLSLSPDGEGGDHLQQLLDNAIQKAITNALPQFVGQIMKQVETSIQESVQKAVGNIKSEIYDQVAADIDYSEMKIEVLARCEAEKLETYNRRDNIKILGLKEDSILDDQGRPINEKPEVTARKVLELSSLIDATVKEDDISIAHRLPGKMVWPNRLLSSFPDV